MRPDPDETEKRTNESAPHLAHDVTTLSARWISSGAAPTTAVPRSTDSWTAQRPRIHRREPQARARAPRLAPSRSNLEARSSSRAVTERLTPHDASPGIGTLDASRSFRFEDRVQVVTRRFAIIKARGLAGCSLGHPRRVLDFLSRQWRSRVPPAGAPRASPPALGHEGQPLTRTQWTGPNPTTQARSSATVRPKGQQ